MKREIRQLPASPSAVPSRKGSTPEVAAMPKGSKEALRKGKDSKVGPLTPSQPHSKFFGHRGA